MCAVSRPCGQTLRTPSAVGSLWVDAHVAVMLSNTEVSARVTLNSNRSALDGFGCARLTSGEGHGFRGKHILHLTSYTAKP